MSGDPSSLDSTERKKTVPARSAREFEIRGKMEKRTGWQEQGKSQIGGEKK